MQSHHEKWLQFPVSVDSMMVDERDEWVAGNWLAKAVVSGLWCVDIGAVLGMSGVYVWNHEGVCSEAAGHCATCMLRHLA
jgi:hypothetical protein